MRNEREMIRPTTPPTIRMSPTICRSMPLGVQVTANRRMAPMMMSAMLPPMVMNWPPPLVRAYRFKDTGSPPTSPAPGGQPAAADGAADGVTGGVDAGVDGALVVGETDGLGDTVVGVGDGVVGVGVGVGEALCVGLGLAGAELAPWAGPTRLGDRTGLWLGHSSSAAAATTTPATTTAPPVAAPAAKARRSRRLSVRRRSRSHAGRVARCAAQLLNGAAAKPRVGNSSSAASSGPLSWYHLVSAPTMPARPSTASDDSAQFARSASHHLARSLVFGVRRNAALRANRPSTDARATTTDVDCQMKKAPIASPHDAPVPRRSSVIARTSPSATSTGIVATRNADSLMNSALPPVARLAAPASKNTRNTRPSRSPYHWMPPARYDHRWALVRWLALVGRPGSSDRQCMRRIWIPPKHHRYRWPLSASNVSGMIP